MPFFSNEKVSLHYLERGRGEALVLIHGLGCSGADWAFQVAALEKRFRVIVPDHLIGFSLGGAVALEMAAQRPDSVPRLGLINSLATYRPDDWRKWLEVYVSATLVRLLGMRRAA
jgi:3-oxoadipate enol-lactonase